jgi:hypothetical protein
MRAEGLKTMTDDEKLAWIEAGQDDLVCDYTTPLYGQEALDSAADVARERGSAAIALLKRIRYHAKRHALPRDWLTAADEVLGTWGPVKLDHPELKA